MILVSVKHCVKTECEVNLRCEVKDMVKLRENMERLEGNNIAHREAELLHEHIHPNMWACC